MFERQYYVYILTNKTNTVLYVGMTNDIFRRTKEHRDQIRASFTKQYNCNKLVYVETFDTPYAAITREKQLKAGPRRRKLELIWKENPGMKDILETLY